MAQQFTIPGPGDIIASKYLILKEIGRGSYGVVFRARHVDVGREVALKTLLPQAFLQSDVVERFQREASMISRLQHAHVVTLYDFGESDGVLYMVMELLQGRDLSHVIKNEAPLPPHRAVKIIVQVLQALQAAHAEGIVHRDLKPENILLCQDEEHPDFVKVLDFGIAKMTSGEEAQDALKTLTVQGYVLGTPYYMAPEVITGEAVTHQADLYAVGLLLYELLCGVHPFEAPNPSAVLVKHLHEPVPALTHAEQARGYLGYAVRRAMAKAPADRTSSAAEFIDILQEKVSPPSSRPAHRQPLVQVGAALLSGALLLCALALYLLWDHQHMEPEVAPPQPPVEPALTSPTEPPQEPWRWKEPQEPDLGAPPAAQLDAGQADALEAPAQEQAPGEKAPEKVAPEQKPPLPQKVREPRPEKAAPRQVQVSFRSEPDGARVSVNGAPVCTAPCARGFAGDQTLKVVFSKIGYRQTTRSVTLKNSPASVSAKLQPGRIKLVP